MPIPEIQKETEKTMTSQAFVCSSIHMPGCMFFSSSCKVQAEFNSLKPTNSIVGILDLITERGKIEEVLF
jgi:hypothetical protein